MKPGGGEIMATTDEKERPRRNPRNKKAPVVLKKAGPAPAPARSRGDDRRDDRRPRPEDRGSDRRGAPRAEGRGAGRGRDLDEGPRFIGGPRNEHGTRIARRVTCARCGTADHVPYVPKDPTKALCRTCAAEVLKTYEAGVRVRVQTRKTLCNLCGAPFDLPVSAEDDGDPLCPSCLRGFTAWQGSVDVPFAEREKVVVEERLSGALVRKRKSES